MVCQSNVGVPEKYIRLYNNNNNNNNKQPLRKKVVYEWPEYIDAEQPTIQTGRDRRFAIHPPGGQRCAVCLCACACVCVSVYCICWMLMEAIALALLRPPSESTHMLATTRDPQQTAITQTKDVFSRRCSWHALVCHFCTLPHSLHPSVRSFSHPRQQRHTRPLYKLSYFHLCCSANSIIALIYELMLLCVYYGF